MSIGVIAISANWLLEGDFKNKWATLKERKYLPLIFLGFFFIHLIWGVFSSDFGEILDDLRRKLPFLALPITIGTSKKLERKELLGILWAFLAGLVFSAGVGFYKYYTGDFDTYRDLSRFVSHIRLGLFLGFGIGVATFLFAMTKKWYRFFYFIPIPYFLYFIKILGSGTGYFAGGLALVISLIYIAKTSKQNWIYYSSISLLGLSILLVGGKAIIEYNDLTSPKEGVFDNPPKYTAQMNLYIHHPDIKIFENGYPVYMNYCPPEVEEGWSLRSKIPIDSTDKKGQLIQGTILRYMTSKGLMKDAEGVAELTDEDINKIENGISSIVPPKTGFEARFQETVLEYQMYKNNMNPNGHSLVQRLYYLEAGWEIFKHHPLIGVTKGDEEQAYLTYYEEVKSPLNLEHRLRAHNQFLSFLVCFGFAGFVFLMLTLIYPILKTKMTLVGFLFLIIVMIGFLSDDMLNRQAGVTYVALFYCLIYLSGINLKRDDIITDTID